MVNVCKLMGLFTPSPMKLGEEWANAITHTTKGELFQEEVVAVRCCLCHMASLPPQCPQLLDQEHLRVRLPALHQVVVAVVVPVEPQPTQVGAFASCFEFIRSDAHLPPLPMTS